MQDKFISKHNSNNVKGNTKKIIIIQNALKRDNLIGLLIENLNPIICDN